MSISCFHLQRKWPCLGLANLPTLAASSTQGNFKVYSHKVRGGRCPEEGCKNLDSCDVQ